MNKKNAVIIGYGGMGGWHAANMRNSDVINLVGVYDILPERNEVARKDGLFTYTSHQSIFDDPNVDFVTIAVPNDLHKPLALRAMAAGKHVVCEKPVTLSSADLQEMIDAANKYGVRFTVHQNRRWDGEFLVMRDLYRSGDLGDPHHIESRVHGSRGIPGDWREEKIHGGGMLYDWGIHLIDQIMGIVNDRTLRRIWCRFDHITNDEVDDGFQLEMYFDGDLTAHVEVGTSNFITLPRFYMTGSHGSAQIASWGQPCEVVWCRSQVHETAVVPVKTAAGITKTMAPRDESTVASRSIPQPCEDVHDFYRNFTRAIDGTEDLIVTHHQMMVDMKILEAAFKSHETGLPVDVELKF